DDRLHRDLPPAAGHVVLDAVPGPVQPVENGEGDQRHVEDPPDGIPPAFDHYLRIEVLDTDHQVPPDEVVEREQDEDEPRDSHEEPRVDLESVACGRSAVSAAPAGFPRYQGFDLMAHPSPSSMAPTHAGAFGNSTQRS